MVQIHFRAVWNPAAQRMNVEFTTPEKKHIELMDENRFRNFCKLAHRKMVIAGWTVKWSGGDRATVREVVKYFRAVLESYDKAKKAGEI